MDGPAPALRHLTLRVEHDCPMARLSRELPAATFHAWSGHRLEVVEAQAGPALWPRVEAAARRLLAPSHVLPARGGGVLVWEPRGGTRPESSISRILEAHEMIWLQPLLVRGGWEHYDAIAFGDGQAALDRLRQQWPTQVARRRAIGPRDLLASLFLSLRPALEAPTPRQAEALLAAGRAGYYSSPRGATTAAVARALGIGRSAFEERLRGGENRVLGALLPALQEWGPQAAAQAETAKGRRASPRRGLAPK